MIHSLSRTSEIFKPLCHGQKVMEGRFYFVRVVIYLQKEFFILSFFVGYILSFGLVELRTVRLSAQVEHTLSAGLHARAGRM